MNYLWDVKSGRNNDDDGLEQRDEDKVRTKFHQLSSNSYTHAALYVKANSCESFPLTKKSKRECMELCRKLEAGRVSKSIIVFAFDNHNNSFPTFVPEFGEHQDKYTSKLIRPSSFLRPTNTHSVSPLLHPRSIKSNAFLSSE